MRAASLAAMFVMHVNGPILVGPAIAVKPVTSVKVRALPARSVIRVVTDVIAAKTATLANPVTHVTVRVIHATSVTHVRTIIQHVTLVMHARNAIQHAIPVTPVRTMAVPFALRVIGVCHVKAV